MDTLEQEILNTEQVIASLPAMQVRALERSLRNLSPAQRAYVTGSLRNLEEGQMVSPRYLRCLEHFFDRWSGHSLATKLVLIHRITRLSPQPDIGQVLLDPDDRDPFALPQILQKAS